MIKQIEKGMWYCCVRCRTPLDVPDERGVSFCEQCGETQPVITDGKHFYTPDTMKMREEGRKW